ncbi:MAG: RNA polymerase sigma factor [Actinomycetota bacterium]
MDVPSSVIDACKQGDPDGFAELIRLSHREVYGLAFRITGNPEDAADVAQDTYMKLLKSIKQFRGDSKFSTWLYRVTSSVAISHMRKKSRRTGLDRALETEDWKAIPAPSSADPAIRSQQNSLRERLDVALNGLPEAFRAVVVMKDIYGFSLAEVGDQLGITEGAAKVRLFRARQRLRDVLQEEDESDTKGRKKDAAK